MQLQARLVGQCLERDLPPSAVINSLPACGNRRRRLRELYRVGGAGAPYPIKSPGRPPRATPAFLQAMKQAAATTP